VQDDRAKTLNLTIPEALKKLGLEGLSDVANITIATYLSGARAQVGPLAFRRVYSYRT
jgi:hypothetical protein